MTDSRPKITPPPHLMLAWQEEARDEVRDVANHFDRQSIQTIKAANWGWQQRDSSVANELQEARDEELKECCKAIADQIITVGNIGLSGPTGVLHRETHSSWPAFAQMVSRQLRAARRPKPLNLKEQALEDLEILIADLANHGMGFRATNIRRALESIPDNTSGTH